MIKLTEKQEDKLTAKQLLTYNMLSKGYKLEELVGMSPNTTINTLTKSVASIEKKLGFKII